MIRNESRTGEPPELVRASDVEPMSVEWLWPNRIAVGKVTFIAGNPGEGKSLLTIAIAAAVTRGASWPDCPNDPQQSGSVILLNAEDDMADTIRPRLDAHRADCERVYFLKSLSDLAKDIDQLRDAIDAIPDCRLIVVDPISAYMGRADSHVNAEVRAVLAPLAELASEKRVAILAVSHLRKGEGEAIYRTMGSLAFVAAARAAWVVCRDRTNPKRRFMLAIKNNLAADVANGLAFTIERNGNAPAVFWEQQPVTITADEAMAPIHKKRGPSAQERDGAVSWLQSTLADGPLPAGTIIDDGLSAGFSKRTLQRAFQELGGQREKSAFAGGWQWRLPQDAKVPNGPQPKQPGTLGETWHLRLKEEETTMRHSTVGDHDTEDAKLLEMGSNVACSIQEHNGHDPDAINRLLEETRPDPDEIPW